MLGLLVAWLLVWSTSSSPPGASALKGLMALESVVPIDMAQGARGVSAPGSLRGALAPASAQAPAAPDKPAAANSRACCAEDGQTCVIQIDPPMQGLAPDGRRARWSPPRDNFSSAERPRRDRPPRLTA